MARHGVWNRGYTHRHQPRKRRASSTLFDSAAARSEERYVSPDTTALPLLVPYHYKHRDPTTPSQCFRSCQPSYEFLRYSPNHPTACSNALSFANRAFFVPKCPFTANPCSVSEYTLICHGTLILPRVSSVSWRCAVVKRLSVSVVRSAALAIPHYSPLP